MNGDTAHSLYTTNDRGVNEAALQEIPHTILFLKIHDLFINSPQLTRRRWRSAIETALYHQTWIQQPPQRMHIEAQRASREVAVSRSGRSYPCATLNSLSEIIRSPSMGAPSRRCKPSFSHRQFPAVYFSVTPAHVLPLPTVVRVADRPKCLFRLLSLPFVGVQAQYRPAHRSNTTSPSSA